MKYCLSQLKLINNVLRLPLTPLSENFHGDLQEAMKVAGL